MAGTVLSTLERGVRTITLNRPQALNAINDELLDDFNAALKEAAACAETRVIVLTGAGRAFCAGEDLKAFEGHAASVAAARRHVEAIQVASRALLLGPHMVVGAIHGWAAGGGLEWALDCDLIVMADTTRCFFPEIRLGMNVTGGISTILPRLVGLQKARELILLGETFDAHEADKLGIAWKVVPETEALSVALATAEKIAALPRGAVRDLKQLLNRACQMDLEGAMKLETEFCVRQFMDPETKSLTAAFGKK
ncbi:MAG: enoyl-CoA hydratase/isomerase family protein [Alphaproteobacteria bacterium]